MDQVSCNVVLQFLYTNTGNKYIVTFEHFFTVWTEGFAKFSQEFAVLILIPLEIPFFILEHQ